MKRAANIFGLLFCAEDKGDVFFENIVDLLSPD
jgi:hypothetical protein